MSTTLAKVTPKLTDNIFSATPFLNWLQKAGNIKKVDGGAKIVEPLLFGTNSTAGSYSGYDNVATTPQEGITAAEYDWKQFGVTVAIAGIEELKNSGDTQIISLLEAKITQAKNSAVESMSAMFFADGTGNSSKDWHGLKTLVPVDPTTGTVGNIDRSVAANAFWRSKTETTVEALTLARMSTMYNNCSVGNQTPDFLVTTQTLWEKYEALLLPAQRFSDASTAQAGFDNLVYKSKAPVVWDTYCTAGYLYFLNSGALTLKVHKDRWMKAGPFLQEAGQDARYSLISSAGNLVTNASRLLGVLSGKS